VYKALKSPGVLALRSAVTVGKSKDKTPFTSRTPLTAAVTQAGPRTRGAQERDDNPQTQVHLRRDPFVLLLIIQSYNAQRQIEQARQALLDKSLNLLPLLTHAVTPSLDLAYSDKNGRLDLQTFEA